ncbi:hypothetical protein BHC49_02525 [Snodgrassella alvi]|uniref:Uncharacterized protein n=1 Tax=Snodgrassella alvi TaxID=1196083 RepID=A0A2N9Y085_9NEIS|nr:hypothetical protein BHC49_02525 [Snodgrassella alvi]
MVAPLLKVIIRLFLLGYLLLNLTILMFSSNATAVFVVSAYIFIFKLQIYIYNLLNYKLLFRMVHVLLCQPRRRRYPIAASQNKTPLHQY